MIDKIKFIILLLTVNILIFSCTKHHDSPGTPAQPELFDTLGAGWQRIQIDPTLNFEDIFFVNNQTGYLCGDHYLGKSTDGGLTWKLIIPDSLKAVFENLFFTDANNGWVFGSGNFSLKTNDGGNTWQKINHGSLFDGQFFDANNGYVISTGSLDMARGLYKTSDGGITLQYLAASSGSYAAGGLFFFDQNKGWYTDKNLNKTEDAGLSFSKSLAYVNDGEYALQFTDALHGWVAGHGGIFRTTNGGDSLVPIAGNGMVGGGDIQFFDNNNGFILSGSAIYSTTDGGTTLNKMCTIHKTVCFEISFT